MKPMLYTFKCGINKLRWTSTIQIDVTFTLCDVKFYLKHGDDTRRDEITITKQNFALMIRVKRVISKSTILIGNAGQNKHRMFQPRFH